MRWLGWLQVGTLALLFNIQTPAMAAKPFRIIAFGDSLTAGFGLPASDAFPAQLERALRAEGYAVEILNAGISGDTTRAGLERLDWAIPDDADAVIVELGANDALRGIDPSVTRANLEQILARLKRKNVKILLAGMRAIGNWGAQYAAAFDPLFPELASRHAVDHYPFFLDGVALRPELNQADGLHPNAKGTAVIVQGILPYVRRLLPPRPSTAGPG